MKYLIRYTQKVDKKHVQEIAELASKKFSEWGLALTYELEEIDLDESSESLYEVTNSWSFLTLKQTKSLKSSVINAFMKDGYEGVVFFVNDKYSKQESTLRGQHTNGSWKGHTVGLMEVYSKENKYTKPKEYDDGWYYPTYNSKTGAHYKLDEYVLIHETLHDLEKRYLNLDGYLHSEILAGRFEVAGSLMARQVAEKLNPTEHTTEKAIITNPSIRYIVLHHTAVSRSDGKNQLLAVNKYHQEKWNMKGTLGWFVGYNYFIDVDGSITQTRVIGEETVANKGYNCDIADRCTAISICTAGNFSDELLNDNQVQALRTQLAELMALYPEAELIFHKELPNAETECAGSLFTHEYLNQRILKTEPDPLPPEDEEKADKIKEMQLKITLLEIIVGLYRKLLANK